MQYKNVINLLLSTSLTLSLISFIPNYVSANTKTSEFTDLKESHWAYKAIEALVEKYQVMEGFPDKKFRGEKTVSRYELAAALYKVIKKIEEYKNDFGEEELKKLIPTLQDDLKAIAALQLEFKKELIAIKEDNNKLNDRVSNLEKFKVYGKVEVRYRDRMAVTDDTIPSSPLFSNLKDNQGNYITGNNLGDSEVTKFNSPSANYITKNDLKPWRIMTELNINANFNENIGFFGRFKAFETGDGSIASGHFGEEGVGQALYIDKSYFRLGTNWKNEENESEGNVSLLVGLLNFGEIANTGTIFNNHFSNEVWIGHGYGLVGWGGHELNTKKWDADKNTFLPYKNSISRFWVGDINVSKVDPDSKRYNNLSAPSILFNTQVGFLKLVLGGNNGAIYGNRMSAAKGNLSGIFGSDVTKGENYPINIKDSSNEDVVGSIYYTDKTKVVGSNADRLINIPSNLLDLPSEYNDGYGIAGVELELGENIGNTFLPVRLALYGKQFWNDTTFVFGGSRKDISGVLDLGWNQNFGMTLQFNESGLGYDLASMGLFFNNISDSGIDIGLGGKIAMRNSTNLFDLSNYPASNVGGYIVLPSFDNTIPRLMLAVRQSFGDSFGTYEEQDSNGNTIKPYPLFKDSGLTISLPFKNIGNLPLDLICEYSTLIEGPMWSANFIAHDLAIYSTYRF